MFWLVFSVAVPMRSVLRTVLVQYSHESPHASAKAISVTATDDATVVSRARKSRRSRKYSRNTAGVSLRAIATPSRTPRGHGVRRGTQSAITSVISTTLICPKLKLDRTGSRNSTAGPTMATASQQRRARAEPPSCDCGQTSSRVSTITTDTSNNTNVVTVMATLAAGSGSQANGANMIAASGG